MRPNIDIPWSIHGKIKEHAEHTDQTIEEAYIETLQHGVSGLPQSQNEVSLPSSGYNDFGPRLVRTQGSDSSDINHSLTAHPFLHLGEHPMEIETRREDMTVEQFIDRLARLHDVGRVSRSCFTVHQLGGALVGRGAANLATALREARDTFADKDISTYKNGHLIYVANLAYESEYLLIRAELPWISGEQQALTNVEMRFITQGVPVTGRIYQRLAHAFGFDELFNATEFSLAHTGFNAEDGSTLTVTEQLHTEEEGYDDPSVTGLMVENPLQNNNDLLSHLKGRISGPEQVAKEAASHIDVLANYDELYCELTHNHGLSDDRDYKFKGLSATYISPLFNRNSTWNLAVDMTW